MSVKINTYTMTYVALIFVRKKSLDYITTWVLHMFMNVLTL